MYDFYRKLQADPTRLESLGNGKQIRDFCYVADTVSALMHLGMLDGAQCEAFNVSSGLSYSVTNVAEEMVRAMNLKDVRIHFAGES